ncbi:hypothetical protein V5799_032179 [Amblyomma americanum]|uniref:Peptidase A1 domain-containing protein n=1 Tax=Amblyomma americanum TaxID=6943 RepID=A0AAQ4DRX4_AMBAM
MKVVCIALIALLGVAAARISIPLKKEKTEKGINMFHSSEEEFCTEPLNYTQIYKSDPFDGHIGLNIESRSLAERWSISESLFWKGLLPEPKFAFYLHPTINGSDGEIVLGGEDKSHYEGELTYVQSATDEWIITFQGVKIGDRWIQTENITAKPASSLPFIYGPRKIIAQIHKTINASLTVQGEYTVKCKTIRTLPTISFKIGGKVFDLRPDDYIVKDMDDFMRRAPFLEMLGPEAVDKMPRPGAIKTHLPYKHQPYSPDAKYIYVTRNPYDCCVSFYHHTKSFPAYRFEKEPFDKFFDMFIEGKVDFGDYFDHQLSWYEHINDENVLIITYEDLKMDPRAGVLKIAEFLGETYGKKLREQPEVLERILNTTSLKTMKGMNEEFRKWTEKAAEFAAQSSKYQKTAAEMPDDLKKPMTGDFVRKGIVGDWKNHFTPEQVNRMKERIESKTKGSMLMSLWKDIELP